MPASDASGPRRRRARRRRQDKPALSARLVLDDHVKTDVGIVSEDLFAELFPHLHDCLCSRSRSCSSVLTPRAQHSPRARRPPPHRDRPLGALQHGPVRELGHRSRHAVVRPRPVHHTVCSLVPGPTVLCREPEAGCALAADLPEPEWDRGLGAGCGRH